METQRAWFLVHTLLAVLLVSCDTEPKEFAGRATLRDSTLRVELINNTGSDVIVKDSCPRPFAVSVTNVASRREYARVNQTGCLMSLSPPMLLRRGQGMSTNLPSASIPKGSDVRLEFKYSRLSSDDQIKYRRLTGGRIDVPDGAVPYIDGVVNFTFR
ncbi:hypothetical protein [Deinococcus koreensis]|nr:hypothetical protein [Deinococcus koreensis]